MFIPRSVWVESQRRAVALWQYRITLSANAVLKPSGGNCAVLPYELWTFPQIAVHTPTLDAALLEVKQQIQKALRQYKNPPIPTKQEQIVVPTNSVLVLVKAG